jgi:hypothetical protein
MVRLSLWLALAVSVSAAEDPREIVRRSVESDSKYLDLVRQYTFLERNETRQLDSKGNVKDRDARTWDITLLEGSPYRRLIARDDKPLPPREEAKEQEKLRKSIEGRKSETPEQRQARIDDARRRLEKQRAPAKELPEAFDFRLAGEEKVDGLDVWVIECTPRKGYKPRASLASFFPKVKGRLWIAKKDYQWVRVEAESIETISFGAILARVAKGATIKIQQTRVNNEVWLPKRIEIAATARIALIKVFRGQVEMTYNQYKKFQAESRIVSLGAPTQ